ncbi:MAG: polymerase sigma factor SigZ [Paenibacillus sp.]|jgi:RNA polymerase sigma-70 factor (ECF subfamily)|nr:polymerase sigma factor SigZ [Paenibacillus sp.]
MELEHLWKEFHDPLKGFVAKRIYNASAVDDIVQTVFIKIYAHMSDLKEKQKIHSWIYQITRNTIIDYYRKEKPTDELPLELPVPDDYDEPDMSKEFSLCIRPMIQQLPDKYREALELTELNGLSQKELSERLGISVSGAKSRVQRGREKLKEMLLACCHIETDRFGHVIDYQHINPTPSNPCSNGKSDEKSECS